METTLGDGDSNADSDVDADDLGVWQNQYGELGHRDGIASVPEPRTAVMAMHAIDAGFARRKQRG